MKQDYQEFLETKKKGFIESGFELELSDLNDSLFDFQKYVVQIALRKGRFALFEDCGLGKTIQQLEWANQVYNHTGKPVLILAPLAVVKQTIEEGLKFGIKVDQIDQSIRHFKPMDGVFITNYDQLKNIDCIDSFSGVVLDESSILKGRDGKLSRLIIDSFARTPYKLACTATPSPNDYMELGQHSEFLGAMSYLEMLAMFFVHDGGETSKWRLRKQKEELKTLSELKRELQVLFNRYIRLSKKMACVSCGKDLSQEKFDAGHYLSTQAHPELRFEEDNVWPQCVKCNRDLHGNLIEYRKGLVRLKGEEFVLNLEKKHEPKNYTKDDIRELIESYKEKIKKMSH